MADGTCARRLLQIQPYQSTGTEKARREAEGVWSQCWAVLDVVGACQLVAFFGHLQQATQDFCCRLLACSMTPSTGHCYSGKVSVGDSANVIS